LSEKQVTATAAHNAANIDAGHPFMITALPLLSPKAKPRGIAPFRPSPSLYPWKERSD
jgi:hypothetical protein